MCDSLEEFVIFVQVSSFLGNWTSLSVSSRCLLMILLEPLLVHALEGEGRVVKCG